MSIFLLDMIQVTIIGGWDYDLKYYTKNEYKYQGEIIVEPWMKSSYKFGL